MSWLDNDNLFTIIVAALISLFGCYAACCSIWTFIWNRRRERFYVARDQAGKAIWDARNESAIIQNYKRFLAYEGIQKRAVLGLSMNPIIWLRLWNDKLEPTAGDFETAEQKFAQMFPDKTEGPTTHCFECGKQVPVADTWTKKRDPNYALCEGCFRQAEVGGRAKKGKA